MIRAKVLPEVLGQIVGDGVTASMLTTLDGALMGAVGESEQVDHKVVGAIASNIWNEFYQSGKEITPEDELKVLLVELETGRLAITSAGKNFLLCGYSSGSTQQGLLKRKVETLGAYLSKSLDLVNDH